MKQEWRFFQPGEWEREINVRSFIQKNYTPYDGDESFLAGASESTKKLWEQVMELSRQEQAAGGVLDMDTKIISTIGIYNVDDVITTGKTTIQSEIKEKLTNRMIEEDIGLSVVNITIQDAFPPTTEVMNAFKNVENAKQGKETAINNANKDRNEKIPQAEAECDQIIKNAEAEKEARINEAQGQVSRFEQMYAEYSKYPLITKQRMFYETMEELLPGMKVYLVDESGTQKLLPLDNFMSPSQGSAANNHGLEQNAGSEGAQGALPSSEENGQTFSDRESEAAR